MKEEEGRVEKATTRKRNLYSFRTLFDVCSDVVAITVGESAKESESESERARE